MTKDNRTSRRTKRIPVRTGRTGYRPRPAGKVAGTAGRRRGKTEYQYAASGLLPRLRLQSLEPTPSRLAAVCMLVAMVALLAWFFLDLRFYVFAAQVKGNSLVTAEEVFRAGGLQGMSIFYIDPRQVAQDIERQMPSITQARVQCHLPARVSLQIREQDVRYVWRSGARAFLVNGEGNILKESDGTHADLLVIQDLDQRELYLGDHVDRAALSTAGRLHGLLPEVHVFEYSAAKGVSLSDSRGWRVYFGDEQQLVEKVATLRALLAKFEQERRTVKVIDLRFAESPSYQ